jgi:hypothetical protein
MTTHSTLLVTVPPTMEQGSSKFRARSRADALWDYNKMRERDGQPPLRRMPNGTRYTPETVTYSRGIASSLEGGK